MASADASPAAIESRVPARLDALPWLPFHTRLVFALGITWVLDGLEVTLAGSVAGALKESPALRLTDVQVGLSASIYLVGAVLGAIGFGWLADRFGRKRLFWITLGVYTLATAASAFAGSFAAFAVCRFFTGAGIGGEYAAINSAIQEWIPARYRGRTDLIVNGSFWIGAAAGAVGATILLQPGVLPPDIGWRAAFGIGAALALGILFLRRHVPESARWLLTHGHRDQAEALVAELERAAAARTVRARVAGGSAAAGAAGPGVGVDGASGAPSLRLVRVPRPVSLATVARTLLSRYPRRTAVGLVLMASQAFCYNAIFFTFALVLGTFFGVPAADAGLYLLPFAAGNFLGPLLLGHWFDTIGRRVMISATYALAGLLLLATALLFGYSMLGVVGQTVAWSLVFFFASAAASSAYLTVGESFPIEIRALAIALFYAFGTAIGGVAGPWLFGVLIGTGERTSIAWGYALGAALMLVAAAVQWRWGLAAERRSLEDVAAPLSLADREAEAVTASPAAARPPRSDLRRTDGR
ncbi:MAG: MFS transporter [Lautropia sp.]